MALPKGMEGPMVSSPFADKPKSPEKKAMPSSDEDCHSRACSHHEKIGHALKAKDHKKAMHHAGHMMLALKAHGKGETPSAGSSVSPIATTPPGKPGMMTGAPGDAMSGAMPPLPSAPVPPSAPMAPGAPRPSTGLSSMWAKLKGGM